MRINEAEEPAPRAAAECISATPSDLADFPVTAFFRIFKHHVRISQP
jgi:hypothetical protein